MVISAPTLSGVQRTRTARAERLYMFDIYKSKHIVFMYLSSCASREVQRSQVSIWDVKPVRAPGRWWRRLCERWGARKLLHFANVFVSCVSVYWGAYETTIYCFRVGTMLLRAEPTLKACMNIFVGIYICEKLVSREITDNDVHRAREPIILRIRVLLLRYLCCLLGDTLTSCGRQKLI